MEKAIEILGEMSDSGIFPDECTYTTIMKGYASVGDTGKAFEYFTKIKEEGLNLDTFSYEALLKACCKSGKMQSALIVMKEMGSRNIKRDTFIYNILIDGYRIAPTSSCISFIPILLIIPSVDYIFIYIFADYYVGGQEEVIFGRQQTLCSR